MLDVNLLSVLKRQPETQKHLVNNKLITQAQTGDLYLHPKGNCTQSLKIPNISLTIQSGSTHYSVNDQTRQAKYYTRLSFIEDTAMKRLFIYLCTYCWVTEVSHLIRQWALLNKFIFKKKRQKIICKITFHVCFLKKMVMSLYIVLTVNVKKTGCEVP